MKTILYLLSIFLIIFLLVWFLPLPEKFLKNYGIKNYEYVLKADSSNYSLFKKIYTKFIDLKIEQFIIERSKVNIDTNDLVYMSNLVNYSSDIILDQKDFEQYGYTLPLLSSSTGSIGLRGYGACDEINGVLAITLKRFDNNIKLFSIYDEDIKKSPHTLVKLNYENHDIFLDAWNGNRIFKLKNLNHTNVQNSNIISKIPEYNINFYKFKFKKELFENGFILNEYNFSYRIKKIFFRLLNIIESQKKISLEEQIIKNTNIDPKEIINSLEDNKAIKYYIQARIFHINKDYYNAINIYKKIYESNCTEIYCKASEIFYKKLKFE